MSYPPLNCEPVGLGDMASRLNVAVWAVRDAFAVVAAKPRGRINRTNWWDLTRDARPIILDSRLAEKWTDDAGPRTDSMDVLNGDPVGLAEIGHRFGLSTGTAYRWYDREILPEPRGEILGGGMGGHGNGKPVPWWDWRRDIEPWGLDYTARTMPEPRLVIVRDLGEQCPSCKTSESIRLVGLRDRSHTWWSCEVCGWTEWEKLL